MPDQPPRQVTRRELLKLSPLLVLGAVAVPSWTEHLLKAGVRWSDTASSVLFRGGHLAAAHPDRDVVPFDEFPYNGFDVMEPEIDFEHWTLKVGGAVSHPGTYTLDQIRALPKTTQNTRHVCVEGWDVEDVLEKFGVISKLEEIKRARKWGQNVTFRDRT